MSSVDMNELSAEIEAAVRAGTITQDVANKALSIMKTTYADLTSPPKITDPKMPGKPQKIKTVPGEQCVLCGEEAIMDIKSPAKPCLVCGTPNTI